MSGERLSDGNSAESLATPQRKIVIKVDFDKTLSGPKYRGILYQLAGPLKFPYSPLPGAGEGIQYLKDQPDVVFGGILTARNRYIKLHTRWQADRVAPGEQITYTTQSFTAKIINLLDMAQQQDGNGDPSTKVIRTVLVDDNIRRVRKAALALSDISQYRDLMKQYGFTLVAFNPTEGTNLESLPNSVMDVISMSDWTTESVDSVLQQLRTRESS